MDNQNIAFNGHCAFAVSTGKLNVEGGSHKLEIDGRTFKFSNPIAKFLFKLLPNRISKADKIWNEEL